MSCLQLKLKDADTNQLFVFTHNKLIECTADNPTGVVELPAVRPDLAPLRGKHCQRFLYDASYQQIVKFLINNNN